MGILRATSRYFVRKYGQQVDMELDSPNIVVQPVEPIITKAINILKRMDANYFKGVRKIQLAPSSMYYGYVESGQDKDPAVININLSKIKQQVGNINSPEAVIAAATTIAHERGHVGTFDAQQGFVGGEAPAEAEEQRVGAWIQQNIGRLQDLL